MNVVSVTEAQSAGKGRRAYHSPRRREQAARTRDAVLTAAYDLFVTRGYARTSLPQVAAAAGVSVQTIEQVFGTKRRLLKSVLDVTRAGDDEPIAMLERAPAVTAAATGSAEEFLALLAAEIAVVAARVNAIVAVIHHAGGDPEIAELARELDAERRAVAAWIVEGLHGRGRLDTRVDRDRAVDVVWVLLDPVVHQRLTHDCDWSAQAFSSWLADALSQLLRP